MRISTPVLAFAALLALQSCRPGNTDTAQSTTPETPEIQKLTIAQPKENLQLPAARFTASGTKPTTIRLDNGGSISIPSDAFVFADGSPVKEPVDLFYREFHSPAEIIASGIPMRVLTDEGHDAWMQTAGMFQIDGSVKGQPVFIAPEKALTVNMASDVDGVYDFWRFDPEQGNWDNLGAGSPSPNPAGLAAQESAAPPAPPFKPAAVDKSKPVLNFEINYSKFPELRQLRGIIWQYAGNNKSEDPANNTWVFKESWESTSLTATETEGIYHLQLSGQEKEYSILVKPCQSGKNLEEAMAAYQQKLGEYQQFLAAYEQKEALKTRQAAFIRSFQLNKFGVHNWDILWKMKENIPLAANFSFEGAAVPKDLVTVYLITGDKRAVVYFPYEAWDKFSFNPDADNRLVALLPDNRFAVFSQEDFKAFKEEIINAKGGSYTFKMKVKEVKIESVASLNKALADLG